MLERPTTARRSPRSSAISLTSWSTNDRANQLDEVSENVAVPVRRNPVGNTLALREQHRLDDRAIEIEAVHYARLIFVLDDESHRSFGRQRVGNQVVDLPEVGVLGEQ